MSVEFKKGDRVIYVPNHANGDRNHPDCEHGVICRSDKVNENISTDPSIQNIAML